VRTWHSVPLMLLRRPLHLIAVAALVAATTLAATACSSGGDDKASDSESHKTTTSAAVKAAVRLTSGGAVVASAGPHESLNHKVEAATLAASQRYVETAIAAPLIQGSIGASYPTLFDPAVKQYALGPDRRALTDQDIPRATADPTFTATPVRFDALADQSGALQLVATTFKVAAKVTTANGPMSIQRKVELTFAPVKGTWLITGYRTTAVRNLPQGTTTTTAAKS
jgi:hypothetical protein